MNYNIFYIESHASNGQEAGTRASLLAITPTREANPPVGPWKQNGGLDVGVPHKIVTLSVENMLNRKYSASKRDNTTMSRKAVRDHGQERLQPRNLIQKEYEMTSFVKIYHENSSNNEKAMHNQERKSTIDARSTCSCGAAPAAPNTKTFRKNTFQLPTNLITQAAKVHTHPRPPTARIHHCFGFGTVFRFWYGTLWVESRVFRNGPFR